MEKARNNALPFLDVLVEKMQEGAVKTSVFRKPTHTEQYLHYNSYQPIQHRAAVVKHWFTEQKQSRTMKILVSKK